MTTSNVRAGIGKSFDSYASVIVKCYCRLHVSVTARFSRYVSDPCSAVVGVSASCYSLVFVLLILCAQARVKFKDLCWYHCWCQGYARKMPCYYFTCFAIMHRTTLAVGMHPTCVSAIPILRRGSYVLTHAPVDLLSICVVMQVIEIFALLSCYRHSGSVTLPLSWSAYTYFQRIALHRSSSFGICLIRVFSFVRTHACADLLSALTTSMHAVHVPACIYT